jgi:hypothetical protein
MDDHDGQERRRDHRYEAILAASIIAGEGAPAAALVHDISVNGVLLLTNAAPAAGSALTTALLVDSSAGEPWRVAGSVIRCDPWGGGGPFANAVAIEFDAALTGHADELRRIHEVQAARGLV